MAANKPVTVAIPLGEGVLTAGNELVVTKADDTPVVTQWNKLASWRTDGSVLHGLLTFLTPDAGDNTGTFKIKRGLTLNAAAVTKAEITASGFDAVITAVIGGTTYSLSAADLLNDTVTPTQDYTHFAGPICSSYVVGGHLRVNGNGAEHASVQGHFEVRGYDTGTVDTAHAICTVENTGCFNSISTVTSADVTVTVGATTVKSLTSFRIGADYRFTTEGWFGTDPAITTRHDTTYIQDTKLVPKYRATTLSESMLSGFNSDPEWFSNGMGESTALDSGGNDKLLAPFNRYEAAYLSSGDERAYQAMRGWNRQMQWMRQTVSAGTGAFACVHPRDESTGYPLNLIDEPTAVHIDRGYSPGAGVMEAVGDSNGSQGVGYINKTDPAHWPSAMYVEYLLTGEYHLLEETQFQSSAHWTGESPGAKGRTWPRPYLDATVRGLCWTFRTHINAAVMTPDAHPLKAFYLSMPVIILDDWNTDARPLDIGGNMGQMLTTRSRPYDSSQTPDPDDISGNVFNDEGTGISTYMDNWFTYVTFSAYERGWKAELDTSGFAAWKAQTCVKMMGFQSSGFCWNRGVEDIISVRKNGLIGQQTPFYTNGADLFSNNYPTDPACPTRTPGNTFQNGMAELGSYSGQILPALVAAASLALTDGQNAVDAWDEIDKSTWNEGPEIWVEWWMDTR